MRKIKIGKDKSNDLHKNFINDPTVSRIHCEIFIDDDGNKFLTDKDSTNGTFVNGNRILKPHKLSDYDIVKVGNSIVNWKDFLNEEMKLNVQENQEDQSLIKDPDEFIRRSKTKKYNLLFIMISIFASFFIINELSKISNNDTSIKTNNNSNNNKSENIKIKNIPNNDSLVHDDNRRVAKENKKEIERKVREEAAKREPVVVKFDIDSLDRTAIPESGYSPYDSFFGKGVYHDTQNSIIVSAPSKTHVVFIVINAYTKKRIRNEFIRKGETFPMTKIPYGKYDYMYFTGRNWSNTETLNNGTIKGGFKDFKSFNKNKLGKDQMHFKVGYYGKMTIKLTQVIGGNLETKATNENDFFN